MTPAPLVEPMPRRIRVRLGDELVADSLHAQLLVQYGPGGLPTYYLPHEDVSPDALVDETIGPDGQRTWTVLAGHKRAEAAAWTHENLTGTMSTLAGHVTFSWRQLEWYEEVADELVADSIRPLLLFETGLPTRHYLPFGDVRAALLEASDTVTENPKIRDLLCFFNERVDLVVDGKALERPVSPWSERNPDAFGAGPAPALNRVDVPAPSSADPSRSDGASALASRERRPARYRGPYE